MTDVCTYGVSIALQYPTLGLSALGNSRRFLDIQLTSASPSIAVIGVRRSERREGPTGDFDLGGFRGVYALLIPANAKNLL